MRLLIVNAGSSSLKLRLLDGETVTDERNVEDWSGDTDPLEEFAASAEPDAVVHRVVHGGDYDGAVVVDDEVVRRLAELVSLAPLHQPRALELIDAVPAATKVACFDTSFHRTLPAAASTYALPQQWRERWGLRRYGFHGLSHAYVARRATELTGAEVPRLVSCHLGSGASVCAIENGRSVDTSMGFTPVEGLVMATRSGSVDPGLLVWLLTEQKLPADELGDALEHRSGLLGLTGRTNDLREIQDADDEVSRLAFDVYLHRIAGEVARMAAALRGVDAIAFTGGVGERSATVRRAVADRLEWLGIETGPGGLSDEEPDAVLSAGSSPVAVCVIAAREDLEMARQATALLG